MPLFEEGQLMEEDDINCTVCLEVFTKPKTLPCKHTFCLACLKKTRQSDPNNKTLTCPLCRNPYQDMTDDAIDNLKTNTKIQYIQQVTKNEIPKTCSSCENTPAYHCSECNLYICTECLRHHRIIPSLRNHLFYKLENTEKNTAIVEVSKIDNELKKSMNEISNDKNNFTKQVELCETEILTQEQNIYKAIGKKRETLLKSLGKIKKAKDKIFDSQITSMKQKKEKVKTILESTKSLLNTAEQIGFLETNITTLGEIGLQKEFRRNFTPQFIPSTQFNRQVIKGIGEIIEEDTSFRIEEVAHTIIKGDLLKVNVLCHVEKRPSNLVAALTSPTGFTSILGITKDNLSGKYRITGECDGEGYWQLNITLGDNNIQGSPLNVKVEPMGLVHTIYLSDYNNFFERFDKVSDILVNSSGFIVVPLHKSILEFDQSGSFIDMEQEVQEELSICKMHKMDNDKVIYSDPGGNCVIMCNKSMKEPISIGKGMLKEPNGLAIHESSRIVYVTDVEDHCVYTFNVDEDILLGKIGSKGSGEGQMSRPLDVTLTKQGHVVVADNGNNRIQMFGSNGEFIKTLVDEIVSPTTVTVNYEGQIIVSSKNKLQLFDGNGVFIKQIANENDAIGTPCGLAVISNKPRKLAVANYDANTVQIYNY